jgi:hypothetical protein
VPNLLGEWAFDEQVAHGLWLRACSVDDIVDRVVQDDLPSSNDPVRPTNKVKMTFHFL